jgi:hypothetical protein
MALNDVSYTHVCMMDADIVPEPGWLDLMLSEMEAKQADVLSVVSPMKDDSGDVSMAVWNEEKKTLRRMTLEECRKAPETFMCGTAGHRMCVNTGLVLMRMGRDWCREVWFEMNDAIRFDENGKAFPVNLPEDWNFSLMAAGFGARVFATRKVKLTHWGPKGWSNQ